MVKKWLSSDRIVLERDPANFPGFPQALPDPQGLISQWLKATQIVPLWAREWKSPGKWQVGPRTLKNSMWVVYTKGKASVRIEETHECFSFKPGDLILIPKGVRHTFFLDECIKEEHFTVHFHAYVFGSINLFDLVGFPFLVPSSVEAPYVDASIKTARFFATKALGWSQVMAAEIFNVLIYILCHHGKLFRTHDSEKTHKELIRFVPLLKFIEQHLANPQLTVADLAQVISLSEAHFRKLFHRLTGMSPMVFVQRRRIERACTQLHRTQMSIKQIAEANGFSDIVFFYRVFKRWMKTTPANYRNTQEV